MPKIKQKPIKTVIASAYHKLFSKLRINFLKSPSGWELTVNEFASSELVGLLKANAESYNFYFPRRLRELLMILKRETVLLVCTTVTIPFLITFHSKICKLEKV